MTDRCRSPPDIATGSTKRLAPDSARGAMSLSAVHQRVLPTSAGLDLSRIDFPVLAIHGSDDSSVDANTERMARELSDFTSSVLPGYGHMSAVSRESGYAEILLTFLNANDERDLRPED